MNYIDQKLENKDYIMGKQYTIADAYLFTIIGWTKWVNISTLDYKNITSYMKRIFDRPAVQIVLKKEDLLDYLNRIKTKNKTIKQSFFNSSNQKLNWFSN